MNKKNNKSNKTRKDKLSNIEDKVDKIIVKNKEKLSKADFKNINIEKFSLKNKDKNAIFYLRKKTKTSSGDSKDIEPNDYKKNLNKYSSNSNEENKEISFNSEQNNEKKLRKQEKTRDETLDISSSSFTLGDLLDSKDLDMVVSDINKLIEKDTKSKIKKEKEILYKKDIKITSEKDFFYKEKEKLLDKESESVLPKKQPPIIDKLSKETPTLEEKRQFIFDDAQKGILKDKQIDKKSKKEIREEQRDRKRQLKAQKKELKAREKELKAKRKELKARKRLKSKSIEQKSLVEELKTELEDVEDTGDFLVIDDFENIDIDKNIKKARKKELKARKKELKAKRKELKARKRLKSESNEQKSLVEELKTGFDDEDSVSGVAGEVEGVVGERKSVEGVSRKISKAERKELRARKKELRAQERELRAKEKKVRKVEERKKGKDVVVGVSKRKGKGLFFKREKSGVVGSGLDNKILEETKSPQAFRVDNIALSDYVNKDEAKLLDDKIKLFSEKDKSKKEEDEQAAAKAIELAKDHIKDKTMKVPKDLQVDKKIKKEEIKTPTIPSTDKDKDIDEEHIFFDEEETSSAGWSPRLSKTQKTGATSQSLQKTELKENKKDIGYLELPENMLSTDSVKLSDLGFSVNQWEELDFYSLNEPFAYVEILREKDTLDKCYFLVEIALNKEEEKTLAFIKETLSNLSFNIEELEEKGYEKYLLERLDQIIQEYNLIITEESRKKIFYYIGKSSLGLGKIDPLMKDPNIEDISCDGANVPLFLYHRKFGSLKSNVHFSDEEDLSSFVHLLAQKCGKHISIAEPMLDATMPDGSRIQMTLSDEITAKGSTFTIRKFRADPFSPPDIVEFNTMSSEMVAYMWLAIENGVNTLFAGGTASGKTTALNAISLFIPREAKIVSIEETREINLPHPNWIPGVARSGFGEVVAGKIIGEIDLYDLMKAALRQRPEYILVGEIRGREAYVLFQAMATGHATYSTVHADSAQSLIHRLEGKPINIPRVMLQSLDVVCLHVITRVKNMRARRCKQIIEIIDIDPTTKEILTNEVFRWDPVEDRFIYSGKSYVLERVRGEKDLTREEMTQEINRRRKIIEWMNKNNVREFRGVAKIVSQYAETPDEVMKKIEKDAKNNA